MNGNNVPWVEKDFSELEKIFLVGRGSFVLGKETVFFLMVKDACEVKLNSF
jgi:hypothetical protein